MPVVYISGPDDHIKRQIAIQEFRIFAFRKADGAIQHKTKLESACPMQPGVSCGLFGSMRSAACHVVNSDSLAWTDMDETIPCMSLLLPRQLH